MENGVHKGPEPAEAEGTIILLHGRGASPEDIMSVYDALALPSLAARAPAAPGGAWYPHSFMASLEDNQPALDEALRIVDTTVQEVLATGVAPARLALLGFSQGACLALEYVLRHPRRYGAVMALTGGYIGPPDMARTPGASLQDTPVFIGANDPDPHVPFARVEESEQLLRDQSASVTVRRYPGFPHAVNTDEIEQCRLIVQRMTQEKGGSA